MLIVVKLTKYGYTGHQLNFRVEKVNLPIVMAGIDGNFAADLANEDQRWKIFQNQVFAVIFGIFASTL